jgi:hypothetical protein
VAEEEVQVVLQEVLQAMDLILEVLVIVLRQQVLSTQELEVEEEEQTVLF